MKTNRAQELIEGSDASLVRQGAGPAIRREITNPPAELQHLRGTFAVHPITERTFNALRNRGVRVQ